MEGRDITDSKDIANSLNSYFTSIATKLLSTQDTHQDLNTLTTNLLHEPIQQTTYLHSEPKLMFHSVTDYEIHRKLATLNLNKATCRP